MLDCNLTSLTKITGKNAGYLKEKALTPTGFRQLQRVQLSINYTVQL